MQEIKGSSTFCFTRSAVSTNRVPVMVCQSAEGIRVNFRDFVPSVYLSGKYVSSRDSVTHWSYDLFGGERKLIGRAEIPKGGYEAVNTKIMLNPGDITEDKKFEIAVCVFFYLTLRHLEPLFFWAMRPIMMFALTFVQYLFYIFEKGAVGVDGEAILKINKESEQIKGVTEKIEQSSEELEKTQKSLRESLSVLEERLEQLTNRLGVNSESLSNNNTLTLAERIQKCQAVAETFLLKTSDTLQLQSEMVQKTREAIHQIGEIKKAAEEINQLGRIATSFDGYLNDLDEKCPNMSEKEYDNLLDEWEKLNKVIFSITKKVGLLSNKGRG